MWPTTTGLVSIPALSSKEIIFFLYFLNGLLVIKKKQTMKTFQFLNNTTGESLNFFIKYLLFSNLIFNIFFTFFNCVSPIAPLISSGLKL